MGLWRRCFPTRWAILAAAFTCLVAPVTLVAVHVHENPLFSPIDELQHWDYVTRLANGGFPRMGQFVQPSSMREKECRGVALQGPHVPVCGPAQRSHPVPTPAYQYEAQQPPLYYAATVPLRWLAVHVFGFADVTGTRAVGALWLVAGLFLWWVAGRVLGLAPSKLGAGALLLGTAPLVIYESSTIANDVPAVFAGSLVLLLGALAWRHPGRWMVPVMLVIGLAIPAFKLDDIFPIVVVSVLFAMIALRRAWAGDLEGGPIAGPIRWWWPRGGALLAGGLVSALAWVIIERHLAIVNPRDIPSFAALRTAPISMAMILQEASSLLLPLTGSFDVFRTSAVAPVVQTTSSQVQGLMGTLLGYLVVAGGLAGLFVRPRKWSHWLGLISLLVLFVGGVVLGVSLFRTYDINPGLSGRYGLAVAPLLVMGLVASTRGRWVTRGLWAVGLVVLGCSLYFTAVA